MKTFNIGDKVIALTDSKTELSQPRQKGRMYIVVSIMYCQRCGVQMVSLGIKSNGPKIHCTCGVIQSNDGLCFTQSKHFAKVDEFDQEIADAVEEENYELAALLRDLKIKHESQKLVTNKQ
jgi:hypothetical protein